jgi:hypothetical protein
LNFGLQRCYQVSDPDLQGLLLSPRARVKINGEYLCCSQCYRALQHDNLEKNPPKFAISNNFAIGTLPADLLSFLTDVTGPLLAPVRPFAYVMSYSGGSHKAITGSFSFFNQNVEQNIGALNFHGAISGSMNVFVVISGNLTATQRQIIKSRCTIDVVHFNAIYSWLRQNNPIFSNMADIPNCPNPIIVEDQSAFDEKSQNPNIENQVEIQYWFPNTR